MVKSAKKNRARIDAEADAVIKKTWQKRKAIMKAEIKAEMKAEKRANEELNRESLGPCASNAEQCLENTFWRGVTDIFCWGKEV